MNHSNLVEAAQHFSPDAAVYMTVLFLANGQRQFVTTLRMVSSNLRYTPEVIVSTLREIEARGLVTVKPAPHESDIDKELHILFQMGRGQTKESCRSEISDQQHVNVKNVNVTNYKYINNERNNDHVASSVAARADPKDAERSWAFKAAKLLDDEKNIACYVALSRAHPQSLLEQALRTAANYPEAKIRTTRGALFVYMVQYLAKRNCE